MLVKKVGRLSNQHIPPVSQPCRDKSRNAAALRPPGMVELFVGRAVMLSKKYASNQGAAKRKSRCVKLPLGSWPKNIDKWIDDRGAKVNMPARTTTRCVLE